MAKKKMGSLNISPFMKKRSAKTMTRKVLFFALLASSLAANITQYGVVRSQDDLISSLYENLAQDAEVMQQSSTVIKALFERLSEKQ